MFYSLLIFQIVLSQNYADHWSLFVEAIYLLTKDNVTIQEIDWADQLLHEFVGRAERLFPKVCMTFNIHLLLHLAKSVYFWGPLWAHSAFAFESGNGHFLKVVHAANGIHHQICRRISLQYSYLTLKNCVQPFLSFSVKKYCKKAGTSMTQNTLRTDTVRYFGLAKHVDDEWITNLNLSPERTVSYAKIVKNGCLYSSSKRINQRSNHSFAQSTNGCYVKLNFFIVDSNNGKEYTIVQKVYTDNVFGEKCKMLKKILRIDSTEVAVTTNEISKVCVFMKFKDFEYICSVPNLHFY